MTKQVCEAFNFSTFSDNRKTMLTYKSALSKA